MPEHVIKLLVDHPGDAPIANADPAEAVVLFADVAGFTPMSEALARSGRRGTEELTGILNTWFAAMTTRIRQYGGSVAEFAGDALTAVFPVDSGRKQITTRRAVQCASAMQVDMVGFRSLATQAGSFHLTMKVGLGAGRLLQTVMGDRSVRLGYVLLGPALERAATAEHHAQADEVVADDSLLEHLAGDEVEERDGHWWLVSALRRQASAVEAAAPTALEEDEALRLAPFLHPSIAELLRSGRREFVNEHRQVTAAFIGLPEVAVDDPCALGALQRYLAAAVRLIAHYGGHFRQLAIGDGGNVLVAFFGAPVSHEDDEERAVRCCLELRGLPGGPYRAGLSTGAVYCGEVGSEVRREYAVIGDSVNLAARLMHAAQAGQILIDKSTHERVRASTVHDHLRPITVKGKSGPINVWAVRALREGPAGPPPEPMIEEPLFGRAAEVAQSAALIERVLSGSSHVLYVTGEAGIGKSRFTAEIIRQARGRFTVLGGASRSHGTTTSYLTWRSISCGLLGLDTSLPITDLRAQIVDHLARHVRDAEQRAPLLAPLLNVPMPESGLTAALEPETREGLLRSLLLECFRDCAASKPILLVLEDCHWIDPASAALLEFLARKIHDQPVLVVVTARPTGAEKSRPVWLSGLANLDELRLSELAGAEAERLVRQRLRERYPADTAVDPAVIHIVATKGEGNPFYLEELVNYLHTSGVDPRSPQALATLELPDGLQRLLMARLDQLGDAEKATIKVASVLGRVFRAEWISDVYPAVGGPDEIVRHLQRLQKLDLVLGRNAGSEREYQFKHGLTQEAAYQSLTFRMRESLHERTGLLIEAAYAESLVQYVDVLAHHYGRTQRVDKQRVWFRAAGDAAKAAFANDAAVTYYERLLPLLPKADTGDVLVELGGVWHLTGRWSDAEHAYRSAMDAAAECGRPGVLAAGQRELGDLFMYNRSYAEAVQWLRRAAAGFDRLGDREGLSKTLDRLTFALYLQGAYGEALAAAQRHRALAIDRGDYAGLSIALNHTGLVYLETGRSEEARALLQQSLETATLAGDRRCLLHAATNLALVHLRQFDHVGALEQGHRAFEVAREIGFRQTEGVVVGNMGEVYRDEGDDDRAITCFAYALQIAIELRDWTSVADQVANVAATVAAQGQHRDAERLFGQAIALARLLDSPYLLCVWLHRLANIHVAQRRFEQADRVNREAITIADAQDERDIRIRASILSQQLQVTLGRTGTAEAIATLQMMEDIWTEPHERAMLLEARWRLEPDAEEVRIAAADAYRELCERTPSLVYRTAYASLTGAAPPPARSLPPLPEPLDSQEADIHGLLAQVATILPRLDGADAASAVSEWSELVADSDLGRVRTLTGEPR